MYGDWHVDVTLSNELLNSPASKFGKVGKKTSLGDVFSVKEQV